jgi:hypothetical protein
MTELSPEAKKLMEAARESFSPDPERVTAVRAAITAQAVAPPGTAGATGGGAGLKGAGWGTQHLVGVGLLVALGGGAAMMGYRALGSEKSPPPTPALEQIDERISGAGSDIQPEPARPAEPTPVAAPASVAPAAEPSTAPSPGESSPGITAGPRPGREPEPKAKAGPALRAFGKSDRNDPPLPADSLMEEVALLRAARGALKRGDAAGSLSFLDRHEASYPRGKLQPERLVTRVLALCELGRVFEARAAAAKLRRVAPRSNYPRRIAASCAGEPE